MVCDAADTASLATWLSFGKLIGVATLFDFGEKRCRKNLPLGDSIKLMDANNKPTAKQGQYLAFIYYYTKLNGQPPAESDMQRYFGTTPPTVHNMVVRLSERGFISREPGRGRTIQLLVDRDALPDLE